MVKGQNSYSPDSDHYINLNFMDEKEHLSVVILMVYHNLCLGCYILGLISIVSGMSMKPTDASELQIRIDIEDFIETIFLFSLRKYLF